MGRMCVVLMCFLLGISSQFAVAQSKDSLLVLSWNLENWFDPIWHGEQDDPAFTPGGEKHWTWTRLREKRDRIAHLLVSVSGDWGRIPDVVAFCEVENRRVLEILLEETVLVKSDYVIVHFEGPDRRGIDCALLYRSEQLELLAAGLLPVHPPGSPRSLRSILYALLKDRCEGMYYHFFVNHWPSRLGDTGAGRMQAAHVLLRSVDSILQVAAMDRIIAVGDFNTNAQSPALASLAPQLVPLYPGVRGEKGIAGSVRYRGVWEVIDWMLVPAGQKASVTTWIYAPAFLLEEEKRWMGKRPHRTYQGPRYLGGVSDHLPIVGLFSKNV